jgi:hypothetical protein
MELTLTELTRREMRELERSGAVIKDTIVLEPRVEQLPEPVVIEPAPQFLTRRQLRELAEAGSQGGSVAVKPEAEIQPESETLQRQEVLQERTAEPNESSALRPGPDGRIIPRHEPLPPIGLRRELRQPANDVQHEQPEAISSVEIEIPEEGFRGSNYLGEPSTQSIMLDIAPEAISLPLDTGEVFSTGSISILSDPTASTTGGLDGLSLDREEAVTGVISIVEPVSARDLIDERSPLGVVPSRVLLKGWWRPWLVGAFSLAMAIAAILASLTIFNALGA